MGMRRSRTDRPGRANPVRRLGLACALAWSVFWPGAGVEPSLGAVATLLRIVNLNPFHRP